MKGFPKMATIGGETGFAMIPNAIMRSDLSAKAKLVYVALTMFVDARLECFPSHQKLGELASLSVSGVQRALNELEAAGVVTVEDRRREDGGQTSSLYRLGGVSQADVPPRSPRPTPSVTLTDEQDPSNKTQRTTPIAPTEKSSKTSAEECFSEFWGIYPIKVGKPKARQAFLRAAHRAPVATIIAGAKRYRDDPNRERAYTAHPTTWLNRDGWEDEDLPAKPTNGRQEVPAERRNYVRTADMTNAEFERRQAQREAEIEALIASGEINRPKRPERIRNAS